MDAKWELVLFKVRENLNIWMKWVMVDNNLNANKENNNNNNNR